MAYRVAGLSDSSEDELYIDNNLIQSCEVVQKYNNNESTNKDVDGSNEEHDCQFRVLTACMSGRISIIDEYIDAGRDVNAFLHTGWTLLLYGASAVQPEVVEHLLKLGADPNKHKDGFTPLMAVCHSTRGTTEQCLACISSLLEAKANPNATNKDRMTSLMYACKARDAEVVAELIKHSTYIDASDTEGKTALFHAVSTKNTEIVKLLLQAKASTTIVDRRGRSVRDIAQEKDCDEILQLLDFDDEGIEYFCPINKVSKWQDALIQIDQPDPECIDADIANILYALSLDRYRQNFKGMSLKRFLQLTETDLIELGMDLQYHRKQFIEGILKFHCGKWKSTSLKIVDKTTSYTIFDGVVALTNIARQIGIIGSSFQFMKNNFFPSKEKEIELTDVERESCKKELLEAEKLLSTLKNDFQHMLKYPQKIEKDNFREPPPSYISKSDVKKKTNWTIILTVTLITGMFLSKTAYIQRLWN